MPDADRLLAERALAVAQIESLAREFDGIVEAAEGVATDDEHDPEGHTIAFERQQVAGLLRDARSRLRDVDDALARMAAGSYGSCESCGRPIAAERLAARPAARTCIACAQ
ncbi:MAG: DnaK suppressor protein [Acidimicrobiaceae bacterium]